MNSNSPFELCFSSKHVYLEDLIFHEFCSTGRHRLRVNGELGNIFDYEEVAVYQDYLALSDYLSPTDLPIVMHLVGGLIDPVE